MGKKSNLDKALEEKARKKAEQKKEDKKLTEAERQVKQEF